MKFKNVQNESLIDKNGKERWLSRSVAVSFVVVLKSRFNDKIYFLAEKRSVLMPNFVGFWALPGGYLDYNETTLNCGIREVFEETGVDLTDPDIKNKFPNENIFKINSLTENVVFTYLHYSDSISKYELFPQLILSPEVDDLKWIELMDIPKYEWAFDHFDIIKEAANYLRNTIKYSL
jgi:8-oxo-dGTP pyrophosphatase MutT (NUDIX family)